MTTRTKTTLIIIGTLLLGMLLGALLTGAVVRHRLGQLNDLRTPRGFSRVLEETIQPANAAQREELQAALQQGGRRLVRLRRQHRQETRALVDSLRAEIEPLLTPEQQKRLDERLGAFRERIPPPPSPQRRGPQRPSRPPAPDTME